MEPAQTHRSAHGDDRRGQTWHVSNTLMIFFVLIKGPMCSSEARRIRVYFLPQVGAGLHVLHSVPVHVAQQHVHHRHGDADSRGRPPAAHLHRYG